jgi:hypothetical protein
LLRRCVLNCPRVHIIISAQSIGIAIRAFLGMKKPIGKRMQPVKIVAAQSVSEHISRQRTGPGGSPNSERLRKQWENERCSKHCGYRSRPDKAGSRRQIPTRSKKSLATRHYQLKCGHAPTATYLKRSNQRDDDQCWWCGKAAQTREHLFRHCRKWKNEQRKLWRAVGRETGWKSGRYRHVQISELFLWRSAIKR